MGSGGLVFKEGTFRALASEVGRPRGVQETCYVLGEFFDCVAGRRNLFIKTIFHKRGDV